MGKKTVKSFLQWFLNLSENHLKSLLKQVSGLHPRDSDLVLRSLPAHTFAFLINSQMLPLLLGWGGRRRRSTFLLPFLSFPSLCKDTGLQTGYCESHRTELEKDPNLSTSRLVVCPCVSRVSTPRESPEDDGFFLSVDR